MNGIATKWLAALDFLAKWIPLAGKIVSNLLGKAGTAVEAAKDITTKTVDEANAIKDQVKGSVSDIKDQVKDIKDGVKSDVQEVKGEIIK